MNPANINLIQLVADELRAMLGDDFDEETFLDTLDGETDAMDIIGALVRERNEAKAMEGAAKSVADEYRTRASRMSDKQKAVAKSLGKMLDAIGERKVVHPLATVSRTKGRVSLEINDESAIPSQLTVTRVEPDNAAIKSQLESGEEVPGACLVTGEQGVTVRVK